MIILARMEETGSRDTGRTISRDRNLFPVHETYSEPHAILYCRKERKDDLRKAQSFANTEGYTVYADFPKGTRVENAINLAKAMVSQ